ncbi:hypothetical protein VPH35_088017 [Triticum aestivum]
MLDAVATNCDGGRFASAVGSGDPAAVLAAVRRRIDQACTKQMSAEAQRLLPVLYSGSHSEVAEALRAASLALADAAVAVTEADDALRLRGIADDADGWPDERDRLSLYIGKMRIVLDKTERDPPAVRRQYGNLLLTGMDVIRSCAWSWYHAPAGCAQPALASGAVDSIASGIQAVQLSPSSSQE